MRNCGIDEELITGDASNREKWDALAEVFPQFAGNPTYEWVHLDLKRRFGIDEQISAETADDIWTETKAQLETDDMRPQELLAKMDVEVVGSTDDPTDDLAYHERAADELEGIDLVPTWRADRAVKIDQPEWTDFVAELEDATEISTDDFDGFLAALEAPTITSTPVAVGPVIWASNSPFRAPSATNAHAKSISKHWRAARSPNAKSATSWPILRRSSAS